ncbi:hypothetical protein NSU_2373 [Novosphingobium pentaromativorans US6-1]|uniref:Uncharacterized protein n=1 Tax=Novosphingobium pentaromativorans US6-1 TaxID=1088721 RepID=G6EDE5_9SPHN|nr:hypothetical protein NSU_2373 [Novosphingobium pentaromativorans US6-1]
MDEASGRGIREVRQGRCSLMRETVCGKLRMADINLLEILDAVG